MEGGAADAGDLGNVGGRIDGKARAAGGSAGETVGAAGIAGRIDPSYALRISLPRQRLHGEHVRACGEGFAEAVAGAEHGREVLIDGVLHGVRDVGGVNIEKGGLGSGAAGPLKIEIGFSEVAFHGSGIFGVGYENQLGIGGRKLKLRAEGLDVGEVDPGLAGNDDFLSAPVVSGVPKGFDVVDGAVVVGAQVVTARSR